MGHFPINLPGHEQIEVRKGFVRKETTTLTHLLNFKPGKKEKHIGYIVTFKNKLAAGSECHFVKTLQGEWLQKEESDWVQEATEPLNEAIKKAIDGYEASRK